LKVDKLLDGIKDKQYVLPEFQRNFVWGDQDIKKYIRSVYNNWPTGTLLIWKTKNPPKLKGEARPKNSGYTEIILDGQQRLTTLYFIIKGEAPPFFTGEKPKNIYNLYFNIKTEEFRYYQKSLMEGKKEWISVKDFFVNYRDAGDFVEKNPDQIYQQNISKLNKLSRIRDYDYYIDEDKLRSDMPLKDVVKIFNLVNKQGRRLREEDLALAYVSVFWPEIKDLFREELKVLSERHFKFDFNFLILCLNAVATNHAKFDKLYSVPEQDIKAAWEPVKRSLEYLINILNDRAYVSSTESYDLKTDALLVPMVYYLAKNGYEFKDEKTMKKFIYWFYLATLWQRYTRRGKTSPLEQDITSLNEYNDPEVLIDNLEKEVRDFKVKKSDIALAGVQSPFFNMMFYIAKSKGAIDWFNGNKLHTNLYGNLYKLERHHVFPQRVLKDAGWYKKENGEKMVNEIANRAFLTKKANLNISDSKPEVYLKKVREKYPQALEQQFIPLNEELWKVENFDKFLDWRRRKIADEINKFLSTFVTEQQQNSVRKIISQAEEDYNLEFKSTFSWNLEENRLDKNLRFATLKTIAAFLNTYGGTLVIGVSDDKKIIGMEYDYKASHRGDRDGFLKEFTDFITSQIGIPVFEAYISTKFEELKTEEGEKKEVFVVTVEKSTKPVYIKKGGKKVLYVRIENQSKPLEDPEEIQEFLKGED